VRRKERCGMNGRVGVPLPRSKAEKISTEIEQCNQRDHSDNPGPYQFELLWFRLRGAGACCAEGAS